MAPRHLQQRLRATAHLIGSLAFGDFGSSLCRAICDKVFVGGLVFISTEFQSNRRLGLLRLIPVALPVPCPVSGAWEEF
jgi:hypothetical protein